METDKIDIHNYTGKLQREIRRLAADRTLGAEQRDAIYRFVLDARAGRLDPRRRRKRISDGRCLKLIWHLRRFAMELDGPFEEVTPEQMDRFILGLEDGSIGKTTPSSGSPAYAGDTVVDFKKIIRRFYGWLLGHDTKRCLELTGWFDAADRPPELRTFGIEAARKMARAIGTPQGRAMVMALFDGGFRPTELFNIRLRDLSFQPDANGERTCFVRVRHSKTKPRTVSLPLATEDLLFWATRHPHGGPVRGDGRIQAVDPTQTLLMWSYRYAMRLLRDAGRDELGERVYPYRFRHASATFYARHLTEYQMCARYGWAMGSRSVQRYIDHSGVLQADTASIIRQAVAAPESVAQPSGTPSPERGPIRPSVDKPGASPLGDVERTNRQTTEQAPGPL